MSVVKFDPGFRLSKLDCWVVAIGVVATVGVASIQLTLGVVIAFTVGHFFLFCNIFRMSRVRELIWSGVFVASFTASVGFGIPSLIQTFGFMLLLTLALVILELRSPAYHGIFWQKVNPSLEAWWHTHKKVLS